MNTFLQCVATDMLNRFGKNLSKVAVIFPNKRASLFMNEYLARESQTPVWSPAYLTINELFQSFSTYSIIDPIAAVCQLYRIYQTHTPHHDSLDRFYGWGEILLADFDDVDKNCADTELLFQNIEDIKRIDNNDFLLPEQEQALRRFFADFSIKQNSRLKEKFLELWNVMGDIYRDYNQLLTQEGQLYEGALYRNVVTQILPNTLANELPYTHYVFVGFNVLNRVEKRLFDWFLHQERALFYWDYDHFYTTNQGFEAGEFLRRNLKEFPNALPASLFDNFSKPKTIEVISAATENAQVRYLPTWLKEHPTARESDTAVVLCNETLLQPVLHVLPSDDRVKNVNITMGFPLPDTPIYSFIDALLVLQTDGHDTQNNRLYETQKVAVKNHPYYKTIFTSEKESEELFVPIKGSENLLAYLNRCTEIIAIHYRNSSLLLSDEKIMEELYREALFRTHTAINRLSKLVEEGVLTVDENTLKRLLREILTSTTVPFHGEPAIGMQVMGVLETRNLDFKHLIMLSVNEKNLPKSVNNSSFIPYNLRASFGLTTIEHKVSVYAFYFYRLLQRAEHITLLYNSSTDGMNSAEMSRFIKQLQIETELPIAYHVLQMKQRLSVNQPIIVDKDEAVMKLLHQNYNTKYETSRVLSPSAINTYIRCKLAFFFDQIAKIRPPKEIDNTIDAATFGTIFHATAEQVYKELTERGNTISANDIARVIDDKTLRIDSIIHQAFKEHYFKTIDDTQILYNGQATLAKEVVRTYLIQLLKIDQKLAPITLVDFEVVSTRSLFVPLQGETIEVKVGGSIDRVDEVTLEDGTRTRRVVDYKTGGIPEKTVPMNQLFASDKKHPKYILQTFIYAATMSDKTTLPITPTIFYLGHSANANYKPYIEYEKETIHCFQNLEKEFISELTQTVTELFNPHIPFLQTDHSDACTYCDYRMLCERKNEL